MSKNRTIDLTDAEYELIAQSGEPGVVLCSVALYFADTADPDTGEVTGLPANTRHPHSGRGKLFAKSVSGNAVVHFFGS
jgi:hypothetical protein